MRPIPIRNHDHTAEELEQIARNCKEPRWARRLRSVAMVVRGAQRREAAEAHGVDVHTLQDWVERYNDEGPENPRMPAAGPFVLGRASSTSFARELRPVRRRTPRPASGCATSGSGSWKPSACTTRWKACASFSGGWASGICRRVLCTPGPTSRRKMNSVTTSASWRRTPRAAQRGRSRSGCKTRAESGSRECSPGSGHARAHDPESPAIGASGIATSSLTRARGLTSWPWDISANERTRPK